MLTVSVLGLSGCSPITAIPKPTSLTTSSGARTVSPSPSPLATISGLVWSEEFDGADSSRPSVARWKLSDKLVGLPNNELEGYTSRPENLSLDGSGHLRITALAENYSNAAGQQVSFTSGHMESRQAFRYGRIESRIKVPAGAGLWPAFWTIGVGEPAIAWPATGEIDIMEFINDAKTLYANVHADTSVGGQWDAQGKLTAPTSFADDWHIYSVDWTAELLVFKVDGSEYHRVEKAALPAGYVWEFDRPQIIVVNLAVGGDFPQTAPDRAVFPAEMLVDYVRVFDAEIHSVA
ncbi:MAG: glycoside hydrolase family 16 protein [Acidobacteria bacterium]|nr:glycoside hydrolase family 16 protein [Acidobacteriota bacterium]